MRGQPKRSIHGKVQSCHGSRSDEGVSGIGEVGLAYGAGAKAAVGILRDFAPFVIGRDPMNVEAFWELLFRTTQVARSCMAA
ncbi:hypothetical protein [Pandoraea terrae]|uniref:hypothetical protein n=1 Tax=Pandoraea terrae TaxID=1537710 RepID=UPI001CD74736|nr:hypothetical protein [Pandoraea terrae]